jgi:hypothetical protein
MNPGKVISVFYLTVLIFQNGPSNQEGFGLKFLPAARQFLTENLRRAVVKITF